MAISNEEYGGCLVQVWALASVLEQLPLKEVLEKMEYAETVVPMLDPTLWRSKAAAFGEDKRVVRILRDAQREVEKMKQEVTARG